ncbi:MAG TPA: CPXCG motif-containing cysteine-rich protein [Steroidobacteraceae bacterium]
MKAKTTAPDEARRIDAAYGLEPVFEPGAGKPGGDSPGGSEFHQVQCPYCGEAFETLIDLSAGSATYIEDCQVCCQPIDFKVRVDHAGALESLTVGRGD